MIHKTAIVDSKAKLNKNVQVGPYCVIGPNVEIGENTVIQSHVNILGNVKIGKGNKIYPFVSINDPQDLKYAGEPTNLIIGDNNKIGDNCIIAGQVGFAGSSTLGNNVMIGGQAGVSGHLKVGNNVQIGGGSGVIKDIPDNTKVMGYPAKNLREFIKDNR